MRKIIAVALIISTLFGCSPAVKKRADADVTPVGGAITQAMLDDAWKEALRIGKGNPKWPLSVPLNRVIYVPSSLEIGPYEYYGITVTQPMLIEGRLVLVETIEIHLPYNMSCHLKQTLVHELLHTVHSRRFLTDKNFMAEVEAAGGAEALVRATYPIDMAVCSDSE